MDITVHVQLLGKLDFQGICWLESFHVFSVSASKLSSLLFDPFLGFHDLPKISATNSNSGMLPPLHAMYIYLSLYFLAFTKATEEEFKAAEQYMVS